jgi:hypothetical protein
LKTNRSEISIAERESAMPRTSLLLFLFCLFPFILCGCGDDDSPTCPSVINYFTLYFDVDEGGPRGVEFEAVFLGSITNTVPTVIINGHEIVNWMAGEMGIVYGQLPGLAYTDSVEFSVSDGDKITSGKLPLPTPVVDMTCNGVTLDPDNTNYVDQAPNYLFEWSCQAFEYFRVSWSAVDSGYQILASSDGDQLVSLFTVDDYPDLYRISSYVSASTGPIIEAGSEPNFVGSYGAAWVFGRSYSDYYTRIQPPLWSADGFGLSTPVVTRPGTSIEERAELLNALIEGLD